MKGDQDKTFRDGEGDAWFRRNEARLGTGAADPIERLVGGLEARRRFARVAELGCANGWRLARLRPLLPAGCLLAGVDASAAAVADGRRRFPQLELREGLLASVPLEGPFDLVIVHFVLHWVDRDTLARSIAEIDRLVAWGGYLALGDFLPDFPSKRHYHHLPEQAVYTYKQDYAQAFLGLGFYQEVARVAYDHDRPGEAAAPAPEARAAVSLLQKSGESYREQ